MCRAMAICLVLLRFFQLRVRLHNISLADILVSPKKGSKFSTYLACRCPCCHSPLVIDKLHSRFIFVGSSQLHSTGRFLPVAFQNTYFEELVWKTDFGPELVFAMPG
mmetsp:Transcript_66941/g.178963  ORF Transcript_66941/g.178963 Transcript_66941/m.178963 type:complete len:107 (-) Transcript_66941:62-382(-)